MKFWNHWPYWLRGGVVGLVAGLLINIFLGESCSNLWCYVFSYGPGLSLVKFLVAVSIIMPEQFTDSMVFWDTVVVVSWILCGIITGLFVGFVKSKKKHSF